MSITSTLIRLPALVGAAAAAALVLPVSAQSHAANAMGAFAYSDAAGQHTIENPVVAPHCYALHRDDTHAENHTSAVATIYSDTACKQAVHMLPAGQPDQIDRFGS